jgi:substrate import-associated zinc metallohydrolase lipoprotein
MAFVAIVAWGCSEDDLDSKSIYSNDTTTQNEFDKWLEKNYVDNYNIEFKYRFEDKESSMSYNLAPADYNKAIALAKMTKYLWLESYEEVAGKDFIRKYCPKIMHLVGSPAYNSAGSIVLGTAEGGMKITLYNVNMIDLDNLDIETLNYWYFKTMHHEFAHILHQTKNYSTDFNEITPSSYQSSSWVNVTDQEALYMGFVSPYASNETQEDFVETISIYVTHSAEYWQETILSKSIKSVYSYTTSKGTTATFEYAGVLSDEEIEYYVSRGYTNLKLESSDYTGYDAITSKLELAKDYMLTSWGIDLDELRDVVQRRSAEILTMDLQTLD